MSDKCDKWDFDPKNRKNLSPGPVSDDLVKRLRAGDVCYMNRAADVLESQSAELTRLRERNAELEKERDALIAALKDIAGEK